MPRFKQITQDLEEPRPEAQEEEQKAQEEKKPEVTVEVQGKEETYEVKVKRVAVRAGPNLDSDVVLVLHQGERICGTPCKVNNLPWLRLEREAMKSHPLSSVLEEDFAWVLLDASDTDLGLGQLLERAPAELGWCASENEERSEVYEVVGKGGINVTKGKDLKSEHEVDFLAGGSLVKALELDAEEGRLRYSLLAGDGPDRGWVTVDRLTKISHRRASAPAPADVTELPVDEAKVREALRWYGEACSRKVKGTCTFNRVAFSWQAPSREAPAAAEVALRGQLEKALAPAPLALEDAEASEEGAAKKCDHVCGACKLALGDLYYEHDKMQVHAECMAQLMLQDMKDEEEERISKDQLRKQKRHAEFAIGWSPTKIPLNAPAVERLTGEKVANGLVAVAMTPEGEVAFVPTACPGAAVNLEYLSIALRVRIEEGREPVFSLDPVDPKLRQTMQIKRFEPHWLKGTSVGHVLFESDYHLKELSLGEYDQPVVGMKSCFDNSEDFDVEWAAREWFVVRKAEVQMSEDGVLIPWVKMGVEAREQVVNEEGSLEDQRVTRPDHPLVKYAEDFTKNFDLIAERKSVVYHLRELAKASVLAKYLDQSKTDLNGLMDIFETDEDDRCILEVPQIWNERNKTQICVRDGKIADDINNDGSRCVYGGVNFGMNRFRLAPQTMASGAIQARRGFIPPRMGFQARRGFMAPTGFGAARGFAPARGFTPARGLVAPSSALTAKRGFIGPAAAISARPGFFISPSRMSMPTMSVTPSLRGVDLGLDKFDLTDTTASAREGPLALSEDLADCTLIGRGFWAELKAETGTLLPGEEREWLKEVFNPGLSDRLTEGNLFVPPDTSAAYIDALKGLLRKEREVRQKRKGLFFSTKFVASDAGPLFPASWNTNFQIARGRTPKKTPPPQAGLKARDFQDQLPQIRQAVQACTPVFERSTEDGTAFRIYRIGSLEVRTTQEQGAEEEVGAVLAAAAEVAEVPEEPRAQVDSSEKMEKVTLYVEGDVQDQRFFVVMETEKGSVIVSEKLGDGSVSWEENPQGVNDRSSLAKVIRAASGLVVQKDPVMVSSMKIYQGSRTRTDTSAEARKRYAEGAFCRASCRAPGQAEQEPFESFAARHYPRLHQLLGLGKPEAKSEEAVQVA